MRAALLLAVLVLAAAAPGAHAADRRASVWIPYWTAQAGLATVLDNAELFGSASPFWYDARGATDIAPLPGAGDQAVVARLRARGVAVVPTVASTMPPARALAVLGSAAGRRAHVERLVALVPGSQGLDVDYEQLARTTSRRRAARLRTAFTTFATDLCTRLHAQRRTCSITVMPRTGDAAAVWRGRLVPWIYDYAALGRVADRVRIMAYDQHGPGTGPGPVAGAPWVRRVAAYAAATIPPERLELGVPLYGRAWPAGGGRPRNLTFAAATALGRRHGARVRWSAAERAPWFRAGGETVWFSDRRSTLALTRIGRAAGIPGVVFWAAGQEDPGTWDALRRLDG